MAFHQSGYLNRLQPGPQQGAMKSTTSGFSKVSKPLTSATKPLKRRDDPRLSTVDTPLVSRPQTGYQSGMRPLPPMLLVLLLWAAGLGAAAQFGKISILYEDLRASYGGNGEVALGLVVSIVGMVGLIFGTTAGLLVARIGPRRAIVTALAQL